MSLDFGYHKISTNQWKRKFLKYWSTFRKLQIFNPGPHPVKLLNAYLGTNNFVETKLLSCLSQKYNIRLSTVNLGPILYSFWVLILSRCWIRQIMSLFQTDSYFSLPMMEIWHQRANFPPLNWPSISLLNSIFFITPLIKQSRRYQWKDLFPKFC